MTVEVRTDVGSYRVTKMQNLAVRKTLNAALKAAGHAALAQAEWQNLQDEKYVQAIQEKQPNMSDRALEWILEERESSRRRQRRPTNSSPAPTNARRQREALSAFLGAHAENIDASRRFGIARFRNFALEGQLLAPEQVHDWIQARAASEAGRGGAARTLWYQRYWRLNKPRFRGKPASELRAGSGPSDVQICVGGTLDRLRSIAQRLAGSYGWHQIDALTFVLTGRPPEVPSIDCWVHERHWMPVSSRVLLSVDPMCTPEEVKNVYRRVRNQQFGRLRRLDQKHLELAVFAMSHPVTDWRGESVKEADEWRLRWNQQHRREWRYEHKSVFVRECNIAVDRLLNVGNWGKRGISIPAALRAANRKSLNDLRQEIENADQR